MCNLRPKCGGPEQTELWVFNDKNASDITAHLTSLAVQWYSLFARDIRLNSVGVKFGIPLGNASVRKGRGPLCLHPNFLFSGI